MKKRLGLLLIFIAYYTMPLQAQVVKPVTFEEAWQYWTHEHKDTLLVVNFWATWCKPCIAELPYFEQLQEKHKDQKVKVILISQDYRDQLESRVLPFVRKKKLLSEVWLMDESNPNTWIDRVSPEWSGAIPATLFVSKNGELLGLYVQEFNFDSLESLLLSFKP